MNLSDLAGGNHSRQKSFGGLKASQHNKSYSRLTASYASNNMTLREDELIDSRSSTSTFETQRK